MQRPQGLREAVLVANLIKCCNFDFLLNFWLRWRPTMLEICILRVLSIFPLQAQLAAVRNKLGEP